MLGALISIGAAVAPYVAKYLPKVAKFVAKYAPKAASVARRVIGNAIKFARKYLPRFRLPTFLRQKKTSPILAKIEAINRIKRSIRLPIRPTDKHKKIASAIASIAEGAASTKIWHKSRFKRWLRKRLSKRVIAPAVAVAGAGAVASIALSKPRHKHRVHENIGKRETARVVREAPKRQKTVVDQEKAKNERNALSFIDHLRRIPHDVFKWAKDTGAKFGEAMKKVGETIAGIPKAVMDIAGLIGGFISPFVNIFMLMLTMELVKKVMEWLRLR